MKERLQKFWKEWMKPLMVVIIIGSTFRSAVADWNVVPTGSMKPTIIEGDRIFVNKVAYDLRVPFTKYRLARWSDPARGDIVVLFSPADGKRLVKRVIGLPGDVVEMRQGFVHVNGKIVHYEPLDEDIVHQIPESERYSFWSENLGKNKHPVMMDLWNPSIRYFDPVSIPAREYFVMGDNRDNSLDSRWFGLVNRAYIVGRAVAVVASLNPEKHHLPRWDRFFRDLQ